MDDDRLFSWKDTTTWPVDWPGLDADPDGHEIGELAFRLAEEYDGVIAYHACRPADVSSYYAEGIRPANHRGLLQVAIDIFASGRYPEVSEADIMEAAAEKPSGDDRKLYLVLDDRELTNHSCHYLRYGSEYLLNTAAFLERRYGKPYRQVLEATGRPTVFSVLIPMSWLGEYHRRQIAERIARMTFYDCRGDCIVYSLVFGRAVTPDLIRSHTHPGIDQG